MIEYLYDTIRAVAGQEMAINAVVVDENQDLIKNDCNFVLHIDDTTMVMTPGEYEGSTGIWTFNVPASATVGLKGRYWYCIQHNNSNMCFMTPIYFK